MSKQGLDYFSFDVDFFQDEKIQFISARFGMKGELVTVRLLCKIYRQGYYSEWNNDIALLFAKSVGDSSQHSFVNDVVNELLKRDFFDKSIFERFSILTSHGIQKRYFEATERRKKAEAREELLLINPQDYSNIILIDQNVNISGKNVDILEENANISKQSKVKESKGNINGSIEPLADSFSQKQALELSELILKLHRDEFPDYLQGKKDAKTISRWAVDIEKLIRIDKKSPENIRQIIHWVKTPDNFWFSNIESGKKLRQQYEKLWSQMQTRGISPEEKKAREREIILQEGLIKADMVSADFERGAREADYSNSLKDAFKQVTRRAR